AANSTISMRARWRPRCASALCSRYDGFKSEGRAVQSPPPACGEGSDRIARCDRGEGDSPRVRARGESPSPEAFATLRLRPLPASGGRVVKSAPRDGGYQFAFFKNSSNSPLTSAGRSCCTQCPAPSTRSQPSLLVQAVGGLG